MGEKSAVGAAPVIRVLLVDDHAAMRDGLAALLRTERDIEVVGTAGNGREAVAQTALLKPAVVVTDVLMPEMNGIDSIEEIHRVAPATKVIVLSTYDSSELVYRALKAGASGYLLKVSPGARLVGAIRSVMAGRRVLDEKLTDVVSTNPGGGRSDSSPLESLSSRERSVLQLIAEGHSNAQVARALNLSIKTVETYRSRLMQKLGLRSLAAVIRFGIEHGLTPISPIAVLDRMPADP